MSLPEPHAWREKSYLTASLSFIRGESWLVLETVVYGALLPPASSMYFCRCPFEVNHFKNDKWPDVANEKPVPSTQDSDVGRVNRSPIGPLISFCEK